MFGHQTENLLSPQVLPYRKKHSTLSNYSKDQQKTYNKMKEIDKDEIERNKTRPHTHWKSAEGRLQRG